MNDVYKGMKIKIIKIIQKEVYWSNDHVNEVFTIKSKGEDYNMYIDEAGYCIDGDCYKIILDSAFLKKFKDEKIAVHCETEEDAEEFCAWMKEREILWMGGYREELLYEAYQERTCYIRDTDGLRSYGRKDFFTREGYTIIKYTDLIKEGKEEVVEEFKVGDRVVVSGKEDGTVFSKDEGHIIKVYSDSVAVEFLSSSSEYHDCSGSGKANHCFDVTKNLLTLINEKQAPYKILKPFTLKDIFDAKPCNTSGELWELCNEFKEKGFNYEYKIDSWDKFKQFKVMMEYRGWFIEVGFIEKVKERPLTYGDTFNNGEYRLFQVDSYQYKLFKTGEYNRFTDDIITPEMTLSDMNNLLDSNYTLDGE